MRNYSSVNSVRNLQAEQRMVQTAQSSKREKMKSMLSMQNIRKQLMNSRKITTAENHRRAKELKQFQSKNPEEDLRMVSSAQLQRQYESTPAL